MYKNKYFKRDRFYADEFGMQMKGNKDQKKSNKRAQSNSRMSEYGKQLKEKQRVRFTYGVSERQFRTLFKKVASQKGITGENFLIALERRLDNVVYRLKLGSSRKQCRQMVVHGHVLVNGQRVDAPSFMVKIGDKISLRERSMGKDGFVKNVVEKRLNRGIKVPEWLILDKDSRAGEVTRLPERSEIVLPIEEHLIVELYSK